MTCFYKIEIGVNNNYYLLQAINLILLLLWGFMDRSGSEARRPEWLIWVPVLLYVLAIIVFYWLNIGATYQSQSLLLGLNVVFLISVSFLIMYLATISYLKTGSVSLLFMGCGALFFAFANLLGGILVTNSNLALTISNTGYLLTGLCFLGSALLAYAQKPRTMRLPVSLSNIVLAYLVVLIVIGLLTLSAWEGITPAFYIQGHGSTLLRQAVLDIIAIEFVLASVCFGILYRQSRTSFLIWYSLGMLLIGLCMITLAISGVVWTPLAWIARLGIYLGGIYLFIAIWNISESGGDSRIPLERVLRETEEKYKQIVETAGEGIWVLDNKAITVSVNTRMADMLGYSVEELIGKNAYDFVYGEDFEKGKQIAEKAIKNIREKVEFRYRKKDGSPLWAIVSAEQLFDSNGKHKGSFAMFTDITERKRAEDELIEAKMQAEMYLDLMGHDISNMHQIAIGQLELAQDVMCTDGKIEGEHKEMIDTSLESLWRSAKLIDNVRKLQKIRSNDVMDQEISLDEVLRGSIKQYDGSYPEKSIKVDYGKGPHIVKANELLRDVFTNLIGNAIKHSNGSKVDIQVKLEDAQENDKKYYKVSIEDDGPGIADDMKERIFNRLQRGETKSRGMGLGLYLVKSLVDSYHGKVWVEDRVPGDYTKGSRFVVLLPAMD